MKNALSRQAPPLLTSMERIKLLLLYNTYSINIGLIIGINILLICRVSNVRVSLNDRALIQALAIMSLIYVHCFTSFC